VGIIGRQCGHLLPSIVVAIIRLDHYVRVSLDTDQISLDLDPVTKLKNNIVAKRTLTERCSPSHGEFTN
jgi:hypothetical protein